MISVIMPVLNEQKVLPWTLPRVLQQGGDYEVVVVDGGSSDRTPELAASMKGIKLISAPRGRATQMNAGARVARGEWLLFLHADTILPEGAIRYLNDLEAEDRVQAGGFRHQFSGGGLGLRLISWVNNKRCLRTRVFYGDQAPFVRRRLFERLGGYPEAPCLEDVLFGELLLEYTQPVLLEQSVVTDSRRFTEQGVWRSFSRVALILSCHKLNLPIPASRFFRAVR